jgi:hypothetical protein
MSTEADIQAKQGLKNAHGGIQQVLQKQSLTIEVLDEDVTELTQKNRALRVSNKSQAEYINQVNAANAELGKKVEDTEKRLEAQKQISDLDRKKYQSIVWHLKSVTGRDIDEDYLRQVYESYVADLEEQKRIANKQEVAADHERAGVAHQPAPESPDEETRARSPEEDDAPGKTISVDAPIVKRDVEVVPGVDEEETAQVEDEEVAVSSNEDHGDHAEVEVALEEEEKPKVSNIQRASSEGKAARAPRIKQKRG